MRLEYPSVCCLNLFSSAISSDIYILTHLYLVDSFSLMVHLSFKGLIFFIVIALPLLNEISLNSADPD